MKLKFVKLPPHHPQKGIALIECLIAMLIFSFGVLGLVGLEARAINFSVGAEDRNRAALFASEIASQMWINKNVDSSTFTASALATYNAVLTAGKASLYNAAVTVTVIPAVAPATVSSANIKITWHPPQDKATDPDSVLTTSVILP